jgi:hypothetical protein
MDQPHAMHERQPHLFRANARCVAQLHVLQMQETTHGHEGPLYKSFARTFRTLLGRSVVFKKLVETCAMLFCNELNNETVAWRLRN